MNTLDIVITVLAIAIVVCFIIIFIALFKVEHEKKNF